MKTSTDTSVGDRASRQRQRVFFVPPLGDFGSCRGLGRIGPAAISIAIALLLAQGCASTDRSESAFDAGTDSVAAAGSTEDRAAEHAADGADARAPARDDASSAAATPDAATQSDDQGATIARLIWRGDRLKDGSIALPGLESMIDEAARLWTGNAYPLDAWAEIVGEDSVTLVALPRPTPLVDAVFNRLALAAGDAERVTVARQAPDIAGTRTVYVVAPGWRNGGLSPQDLGQRLAAADRAELLLVDLTTPEIDGGLWAAGEVVLVTSPAAAALVSEYVLSSRATGQLADAAALAERHAIDAGAIEWLTLPIRR